MFSLLRIFLLALAVSASSLAVARAADPPSPAAAMVKLLKSGRVPEERLPTIVELVCLRGNADDLAFVYEEVQQPEHWPTRLRVKALQKMLEAARNRHIIPTGDLSSIVDLLESDDSGVRASAVPLAGAWQVGAAESVLVKIVKEDSSRALKQQALQSISEIDVDRARALIHQLAGPDQSFEVRELAVAAWVRLDESVAAEQAAKLLQAANDKSDLRPLIEAFLNEQSGSATLAEQLQARPPQKDVAKMILREMYAAGRTDAELNDVLSEIAGINSNPAPPTPEEVQALVQQVNAEGNAERGELVFRRRDLSCMKCHSVSKAGGQVGPDLSAVGASSPVDYLVTSVLDPDQAIKEAFLTKTVATAEGRIHQGILVDRTPDVLVLKNSDGVLVSIPVSDIDAELEGKSLMPKGLVKFMTHAELVDLVKFLSMLGKPGEFAVRNEERMQRYRVLPDVPTALLSDVPDVASFEDLILSSPEWEEAYAKVDGDLPLKELVDRTGETVLYIKGEFEAAEPTTVQLQFQSLAGMTVWLDSDQLDNFEEPVQVPAGRHSVVCRIDTAQRPETTLHLVLQSPEGSPPCHVIDGQ